MARSWARFAALGETAATKRLAGTGGFLMVVACVLAVATVVTALCATRRRRKEVTNRSSSKEWTADSSRSSGGSDFQCNFKFAPKSPLALINSIRSKKLLVTKKWGRSEDEELKAYDRAVMEDGDFLWQRTILMGERCQPPDFSGVIIYDHQGGRHSAAVRSIWRRILLSCFVFLAPAISGQAGSPGAQVNQSSANRAKIRLCKFPVKSRQHGFFLPFHVTVGFDDVWLGNEKLSQEKVFLIIVITADLGLI